MTLEKVEEFLNSIGYKIDRKLSFTYMNESKQKTRSHYVREIDSNLGAFSVKARRDENYLKLQDFRSNEEIVINGVLHEF